jgi:hypothetical protein
MHKLTLMLAAGAVGAVAVSVASRADAGALGGADGLRIAIDDVSTHAMPVHYYGWRRPWRRAYGWGWGWRRPYYAGWGGWGWRRPYYAGYWGWRRPYWGGYRYRPIYGAVGFGWHGGWGHRHWGWGGPRIGFGVGFGW